MEILHDLVDQQIGEGIDNIPLVGSCNTHDDSPSGGGALLSLVRIHLAPADRTSGRSASPEIPLLEGAQPQQAFHYIEYFRQEFTCRIQLIDTTYFFLSISGTSVLQAFLTIT
jgi:hypothetical protein